MKKIKLFEQWEDPFNEDNPINKYNVGDTLICKTTFGEANVGGKYFYIKGNEYKIVEIDNIGYTMSFYGKDRNGVMRDIVDFYPLREYELELYFVKK